MQKTTLFAISALLGASNLLSAGDSEEELRDALSNGRTWLNLRYRAENVDGAGKGTSALASTLRTVLGYETGAYRGFRVFLEFEDVAQVGDDTYNSTANGKGGRYPTVADPTGSNVNQAFLSYDRLDDVLLRFGRQEIILDNARFVGNVGWRQNHQSLDSLTTTFDGVENLALHYSYVHGINTITGGNLEAQSHLFNAGYKLDGVGKLTGYYYHLDIEDAPLASVATIGVRFAGSHKLASDTKLNYVAEYADQSDVGDNTTSVNQDYYDLELGIDQSGVNFNLALEHLGGSGKVNDKFRTPLATGHKFNGYADQFLVVPDTGLEDMFVSVGGKIAGLACRATYHTFESDSGSLDYGDELDITIVMPVGEHGKVGIKYADFNRDDAAAGFQNTRKVMLWASYGVL